MRATGGDLQAYLNSYPVMFVNAGTVVTLGSIQEVLKVIDKVYVKTSNNAQIVLSNTSIDKVLEQWKEAFNIAMNNWFTQTKENT